MPHEGTGGFRTGRKKDQSYGCGDVRYGTVGYLYYTMVSDKSTFHLTTTKHSASPTFLTNGLSRRRFLPSREEKRKTKAGAKAKGGTKKGRRLNKRGIKVREARYHSVEEALAPIDRYRL